MRKHSHVEGRSRRRSLVLISSLAVCIGMLGALASGADATQYQRPLVGVLGSAEQPLFSEWPSLIAVDPTTGDVLIAQYAPEAGQPQTISRFHSDGTPAAFAALGTNKIDGMAGPGGKPCAEEPASCDRTPQNGIQIPSNGNAGQIAVSPTTGEIYITQENKGLVDIFSAEGRYLGQLTAAGEPFVGPTGVAVDSHGAVFVATLTASSWVIAKFETTTDPPTNQDNTAVFPVAEAKVVGQEGLGHLAAGIGPSAGSLFVAGGQLSSNLYKVDEESGKVQTIASGYNELVAVDPTNGNPLALAKGELQRRFVELVELHGSGELEGSLLSRTIVENEGTNSVVSDYAFDSSGNLYVVYLLPGVPPVNVLYYGGQPVTVPTVALEAVSELTSSEATLNGTVNPEGVPVGECFFEWGKTISASFPEWEHKAPCESSIPTDSSSHRVQAKLPGLEPNGVRYNFRLAARNGNGTERTQTEFFTTASTVVTEPAVVTGKTTATLNGLLRPEGSQYTECVFEWGMATHRGFEHVIPCTPDGSSIPADHGSHTVSAALAGLQEQTRYRFLLRATNGSGTRLGSEASFETFGAPQIAVLRASGAGKSTVTLEAEVNPSGFQTSYWFEWGQTRSYGNRVPFSVGTIAPGEVPVRVMEGLGGLSTGAEYHYRVVAESSAGTRESADQTFETVNDCGLPEGRCLELASPRQLGPIAAPGRQLAKIEFNSQAGVQPGRLAYTVEAGLPEATRGTQVLYLGARDDRGWTERQLSPPTTAPNELKNNSNPSQYFALSPDLSCGVLASNQPLTRDPQARLVVESGGGNLYRRAADGSYDLITNLAPENPEAASGKYTTNYTVDAVSSDCDSVIFESNLKYRGIAGRLYEWHEGTLSGVAEGAVAGTSSNHVNVLSEDGSRLFYSATRQTEKVAGEVGTTGIFVREGGHSYDLSASDTAIPDEGATYLGATPDGSHVYFKANAGLTAETSESGTDLYECAIVMEAGEPRCTLKDLSPEPAGVAEAAAVLGFAEDGSHVYFAARAQLLPGRGPTSAENEAANEYSIYGAAAGGLAYVGTIPYGGINGSATTVQSAWASRTSPDGRYLLFESTAKVTRYENSGRPEVYLYDSQAAPGLEATICVSCRQDGGPPIVPPPGGPASAAALLQAGTQASPLSTPRSLVVRNGRPEVFFRSLDSLAPSAPSGEMSLYEWVGGQVFLVAAQPRSIGPKGASVTFIGADAGGSDLYFFDAAALNWENREERFGAWDARVGGGFAEPPPASPGCEPGTEGSCQGSSTPGAAVPSPSTATNGGAGNVKPKHHRKKHHRKKHHRKKHHRKKHRAHSVRGSHR